MRKMLLLCVFFMGTTQMLAAQTVKRLMNDAKEYMENQAFNLAAPLFEQALAQEPDNVEANFGAGIAHLRGKHRQKSLPYLQKVYKLNPSFHPELKEFLAEAHQIKLLFKEASKLYQEMKAVFVGELAKTKNKEKKEELESKIKTCDKHIEECRYGESYLNAPVDAQIENVGSVINSHFPDYAPVISADESMMVFTSRRDDSTGGTKDDTDNQPCEDIYVAFRTDNGWTTPKNVGSPVNSRRHDACLALSPDGKKLFVYRDDARGTGDIYYSTTTDGLKWSSVDEFKEVNSPEHETSISITEDGNTVYFASNREGGLGGLDIWKCEKNEKGKWGKPVNMGEAINTPYDDDAPFVLPDGKTLYYSSKGLTTMGGYDIFRTELNEGKWGKPENLGYPINTPDNDVFFVISANGRHGYYASPKDGGQGEEDIYVVIMPRADYNIIATRKKEEDLKFNAPTIKIIEPVKVPTNTGENTGKVRALLRGKVTDKNTKMPLEADVVIVDMDSNETTAEQHTNGAAGEYNQDPIPDGHTYLVRAEKEGYLFDSQTITIPKIDKNQEYIVDLELEKLHKGAKTRLRVYFDFDKATLRKESTPELQRFVAFMKKYPTAKVEIAGHTDNIGTDQKNKILSGQRAKMVMDYLIEHGIAADRLRSEGYGFHKPVAPNRKPDGSDNPDGRQMNRRTECEIVEF